MQDADRVIKVAFGSVPKDGGTFTFYRNMRPALKQYGVELLCVTVGRREASLVEPAYVDDGCVILAANERSVKKQALIFADWCEREEIDIVIATNSAAMLSSLPCLPQEIRVVSRCASGRYDGYRITMSARERLMRIIALTPRLRDDLVSEYGADINMVELIPNGIDPECYLISGNRKNSSNTRCVNCLDDTLSPGNRLAVNRPLQIGFLGRLHEDKGIIFIQVTRTYYFSFLSFARHKDLSGLQGEWSCTVGEVQLLPRTVDPAWSAW